MHWLDVVSNPRAITHLYNEVPPLVKMEVTTLILKSAGPTLTFYMDMPRFADHKPERWDKECNTVSVEIDLFGVQNLQITGFSPMQILDFHLKKEGRQIAVSAIGKHCAIDFLCLDVFIQKTTGYAKQMDET